MPTQPRSIGVLGANSALGRLLVARLRSERAGTVVALDPAISDAQAAKLGELEGVKRRVVDLSTPAGSAQLTAAIDGDDIDTLVYLGFLTGRRDRQERHAEEVDRVAKAVAERPVQRLVFTSSSTIYGALPGDPTYSDEDTAFATTPRSEWVRDKVAAERRLRDLTLETDAAVGILRFAMVLGHSVPSFITDYLARKAVPVIIDQDPSMQFVHENDVVGALVHAVKKGPDGPFNIVGEGAIPLSVALRSGRRRAAPVPELGSYPLHQALWDADVTQAPDVLHDLFRYVWVADGSKAHDELGFQAQLSTKEAVEDFYRKMG